MKNVAIVAGAGAVENAWSPILKIFKLLHRGDIDGDAANSIFAGHIYRLRFYSSFPRPHILDDLEEQLSIVSDLKTLICEQLAHAQNTGAISVRKEFLEILQHFVYKLNNKVGFLTTNWDTTVADAADEFMNKTYNTPSARCFHIHGSIKEPYGLYLPSETSRENYRSAEENDRLGMNHALSLRFLKDANQIILYGLSLDPLDAELGQILNATFTKNSDLEEIIIINPEYAKVKQRVVLLIPYFKDIKITCFDPNDLTLPL